MKNFLRRNKRLIAFVVALSFVFTTVIPENYSMVFASEISEDATSGDAIEMASSEDATINSEADVEGEAEAEEVEEDDGIRTLYADLRESGCSITVNATSESLPYPKDELSLSVRELEEGSIEYYAYLSDAAKELGEENTDDISFARFFDIEILYNGEKVEPESPVEVKIDYDEAPEIPDGAEMNIVHFGDEGTEVINDVQLSKDASEISYDQGSFSVTATIITDSTSVDTIEQGHRYALVAQVGSDYYVVNFDGSLKKVTKTGDDIKAEDLYLWTYIEVEGKNYLRFVNEGYDYNTNDLPETYGYTYIDPGVNSGLSVDIPKEKTSESEKTSFDTRLGSCYVSFTNDGRLKLSDENKYLSVDSQVKKIIGNSTDGGSAKFYLANASNFKDCLESKEIPPHNTWDYGMDFYKQNQIDHIDISVQDTVVAKIPLAYGKYYNANGEEVLTVTQYTDISVSKDLDVNQDLLRNAKIIATDKNGDELDDAFCITGYSSNPKDNSDNSTQVRIEGMFKVSAGTLPEPNQGNTDKNKAYNLNNPIYYSLYATQKNVTFPYIYPGIGQLYDAKGNALSITTDVDLKLENMYYFDFQNNRCPVINGNMADDNVKAAWREGTILNTGTSGMDYIIKGDTDIQLDLRRVAINVSNDLRDTNGNIIKPKDEYNNIRFNVIQNFNGDSDSVKDVNIGSYITDVDLNQYNDNSHDINSYIDKTGSGLINDYEVFDGMVNVKEDIDTVPKVVIDQDGNIWVYQYSYIETENVNRGDGKENLLHVGNQSSTGAAVATPEVLGDYTDINGGDRFSEFVEFFAHNVYDKVDPPKKVEITPYSGIGTLGGVKVSDEIEYEISYENYSDSASYIIIEDQIDANAKYISSSPTGSLSGADATTGGGGKVSWTIRNVPAGATGTVKLKVEVLEGALVSNGGKGKVVNGGSSSTVQVGSYPKQSLDLVENPVPEPPTKKEITPYNGTGNLGGVNVDDTITYEIDYKNYKSTPQKIEIIDKLDKNVTYVSSNNGSYDSSRHIVTWSLDNIAANTSGKVTLTVKVKEDALKSKGGPGYVVNGGRPGSTGNSYATVQVGNDSPFELEEVTNPVPKTSEKTEISPYQGKGELGAVEVGDKITYRIDYENYKTGVCDIKISDKLDANVEYVEASCESGDTVNYDSGTHTVNWVLKDRNPGDKGYVTLTVKVLEGACKSNGGPGEVLNGGSTTTVQVGNDNAYSLDEVKNPVNDPKSPDKPDDPKDPEKKDTKVTPPDASGSANSTPSKSTAKTGDTAPFIPVIIVMILSGVCIAVLIVIKRRKNRLE